jgi:hypothetical protein
MRKTGKGSNNNAAQAEYVRLAALSYSLKSLKSSSYRFVFARPAQVQRIGCGGWSRQRPETSNRYLLTAQDAPRSAGSKKQGTTVSVSANSSIPNSECP